MLYDVFSDENSNSNKLWVCIIYIILVTYAIYDIDQYLCCNVISINICKPTCYVLWKPHVSSVLVFTAVCAVWM